jgi:hypothetical protein
MGSLSPISPTSIEGRNRVSCRCRGRPSSSWQLTWRAPTRSGPLPADAARPRRRGDRIAAPLLHCMSLQVDLSVDPLNAGRCPESEANRTCQLPPPNVVNDPTRSPSGLLHCPVGNSHESLAVVSCFDDGRPAYDFALDQVSERLPAATRLVWDVTTKLQESPSHIWIIKGHIERVG